MQSKNDLEEERKAMEAHRAASAKFQKERNASLLGAIDANAKKKDTVYQLASSHKKKKDALTEKKDAEKQYEEYSRKLQYDSDDEETEPHSSSWMSRLFPSSNNEISDALSPTAKETVKASMKEAQKNLVEAFGAVKDGDSNSSNGGNSDDDSRGNAPSVEGTGGDGLDDGGVYSPPAGAGVAATRPTSVFKKVPIWVSPKKDADDHQKVWRPVCLLSCMLTIVLTMIFLVTSSIHSRLSLMMKRRKKVSSSTSCQST